MASNKKRVGSNKASARKTAASSSAPKPAAKPPQQSRLGVLVDGKELPEADARALWTEFSRYMDEHEADLAGFAAQKGFVSVKPEHRQGRALLLVSRG